MRTFGEQAQVLAVRTSGRAIERFGQLIRYDQGLGKARHFVGCARHDGLRTPEHVAECSAEVKIRPVMNVCAGRRETFGKPYSIFTRLPRHG